jgi:hypothetical protein
MIESRVDSLLALRHCRVRKHHVASNRVKLRDRRNELPRRYSRGLKAVEILNGTPFSSYGLLPILSQIVYMFKS